MKLIKMQIDAVVSKIEEAVNKEVKTFNEEAAIIQDNFFKKTPEYKLYNSLVKRIGEIMPVSHLSQFENTLKDALCREAGLVTTKTFLTYPEKQSLKNAVILASTGEKDLDNLITKILKEWQRI